MPLDAYDLYSELWRTVVVNGQLERVVKALKGCTSDTEIICSVRRLVDEHGMLEFIEPKGDGKDESKAIACRKRGNECFHPKVKKYVKAVEHYNESIALAEARSETLAIAYANRSAVCFELREYEACLENIRLARQNPYPENLLGKLAKREADCLDRIQTNEGAEISEVREPKLSYKPNPLIPHVSDCLELKEDSQFGRYLVTNRNLSAGDVVIVEKPFSRLLAAQLRYLNCDYCHQDAFLSLIPCESCSVTMFCSKDCQKKANEDYHSVECPIIRDMHFLFTKVILMALRTTTMAISTFGGNLDELRLHIESIDESNLHPFKLDWNGISAKEVYSTIHVLATNQKLRTPGDLTQRAIYAIVMSEVLFGKSQPLNDICGDNESHRDLVRRLIFRHAQTAPVNMHSLMYMDYSPDADEEQFRQESLGCGSFPILSMINHSCAPNVVRVTLPSGCVAALINRPVKKGEQLFDNYGYHHCLEPLTDRQSGLRAQYSFKCQCEACRKNYPLYFSLKRIELPPNVAHPINNDEFEKLREHDMQTALKKMPDYCRFINTFAGQYPCFDVSSVQEALLRCFQVIFATQTRKLKYKDLSSL
uniref:Protein-lysine N-methyltransferase SMYD4 n=1 Tax=Culex tarsalis TaxID=7177 RepID=A0A1Q3FCS2_CULTA